VDDSLIPESEVAQLLGLNSVEDVLDLKRNWIKNFIYSGGFKLLQNSLEKVIALNENKKDQ